MIAQLSKKFPTFYESCKILSFSQDRTLVYILIQLSLVYIVGYYFLKMRFESSMDGRQ